ncbi:hypothetical protein G7068_07635 [Leucobacter viscericola]|uniref:Uncharacterized protein n=1 Tax=Leucobacter viscericola TaxID=2714935 RepID=A0A6G7XER3_9MICO|nr:hypothetical protein [Leucobacter viscericola]QIK63084.1 hypothetical protein G7068_07635 [Leucobacter viscericola]
MPTTLPRFQVTETPEVARALEVARLTWPDLRNSERVRELLIRGAHSIEEERLQLRSAEAKRREAALEAFAGSLTGVYEAGYLERLREDWPE